MTLLDGVPATPDDLAALALYNYGHFTSMTVEGGRVRGLPLHLDRLAGDCRTLFGADLDRDRVRRFVRRAIDGRPPAPHVVRVTVFAPELGLGGAGDVQPRILVTTRPAPPASTSALRLTCARYQRELPQVKHVGLFATAYHRRVAVRDGADDVLFVDPAGRILEGATWNIGFFDGRRLIWPDSPCLPGVTMRLVWQALATRDGNGVPCVREPVGVADLERVRFAFVTNAALGVRPVRSIDGRTFAENPPILGLLREAYLAVPGDEV